MQIRVDLIPEPDGGFSAVCPQLPGCQSQGDTREEAIANIKEAIELYLEPGERPTSATESLTFEI